MILGSFLALLAQSLPMGGIPTRTASTVPALVQRAQGPNTYAPANRLTANPSVYKISFPDGTQAGNLEVVSVTDPQDGGTVTVSDDKANTISVAKIEADTTNTQNYAIYYSPNIIAGTKVVSVSINKAGETFLAAHIFEFDHIASATPLDGTPGGNFRANASVTCSSMTPTQTGDLAFQGVFASGNVTATSFTAGSQSNITWQLGTADIWDGMASQWGVYASTAALVPTMAFTAATTGYNSGCVFFKSAAGGADLSGLSLRGILHQSLTGAGATGGGGAGVSPATVQAPIYGNGVIVAMMAGSGHITTITSTPTNTWTCTTDYNGAGASTTDAQFCYSVGGTYGAALKLTVTLSSTTADYTLMIYDVNNANTGTFYDAGSTGQTNGNVTTTGTVSISGAAATPAVSTKELVIGMIGQDANTANACSAPAGCIFDSITYNNEPISTGQNIDQNNGWAHVYTTSTSPITFTFGFNNAALAQGKWTSIASSFE